MCPIERCELSVCNGAAAGWGERGRTDADGRTDRGTRAKRRRFLRQFRITARGRRSAHSVRDKCSKSVGQRKQGRSNEALVLNMVETSLQRWVDHLRKEFEKEERRAQLRRHKSSGSELHSR